MGSIDGSRVPKIIFRVLVLTALGITFKYSQGTSLKPHFFRTVKIQKKPRRFGILPKPDPSLKVMGARARIHYVTTLTLPYLVVSTLT